MKSEINSPEVEGVGRDVQLQLEGPQSEVPCFAGYVLRRLCGLIHFRREFRAGRASGRVARAVHGEIQLRLRPARPRALPPVIFPPEHSLAV